MRWIFITLVLINLGYFGFHYLYDDSQRPAKIAINGFEEDVELIYLLSENSNDSLQKQEMDLVITNPVREAIEGDKNCLAIGPFSDLVSGQNVSDRLSAVDLSVELKAIDKATGENDYRVMIPPVSSLQEAFRKLRELKFQDIDSYVITQGKDALGISLGVYSSVDAASRMQTELKDAGYETDIVDIPTRTREFWIFAPVGQIKEMNERVWQSILENHPGLERQPKHCLDS